MATPVDLNISDWVLQPEGSPYRYMGSRPTNSLPSGNVWITGTPTEGEVLTANNNLADLDGLGAFSYQWTNSQAGDIGGATSSTYTLQASDVGDTITVTVSYTDGESQAESKTSAPTLTITGIGSPYTPPAGDGLLVETFESANMSTRTNADGFSWNANNRTSVVSLNPTETWCTETGSYAIYNNAQICEPKTPIGEANYNPYEGNNCLRFRYPATLNTEAEQRFNLGAPQSDLWLRYWLRVPTNYSHAPLGTAQNSKLMAFWMDGYTQNGQGPTAVWEMRPEADGVSSYVYFHYNMGGPTILTDAPVGTFQADEVINCSDGGTATLEEAGLNGGKYFMHFFETNTTGSWAAGSTVTGATSGATANITTSAYRWPVGSGNAGGDKQETSFITVPDDRGRWMQIVFRVKAATSNTADDGILDMWRRWDGETSFTKLHSFSGGIIPVPIRGPAGWQRGYFMGSTHGYTDDTEWFIDKVEFSKTPLV